MKYLYVDVETALYSEHIPAQNDKDGNNITKFSIFVNQKNEKSS